ncbi:MAG: outer membrane protein assembly factor BamC [Methylobacter sp.]
MRVIVKSLLLIMPLVACGLSSESRYRDTEALERPPVVAKSTSREQRVVDTSSIPKRSDSAGLGADVYQSTRTQLTLKQPMDKAWNTLGRAIKLAGLKVTDHERDKGFYYVTRETEEKSGFLANAASFFGDDATIYLLTVKALDDETTVTATVANAAEQSSTAGDKAQPAADGLEDLVQLLYTTLHDKIELE